MALIFNSSGKFAGLQPNRPPPAWKTGIRMMSCAAPFSSPASAGKPFVSLTPEQLRKYESLYSREMLFPLPKKKERRNEHER